jgi:hypothetical protein
LVAIIRASRALRLLFITTANTIACTAMQQHHPGLGQQLPAKYLFVHCQQLLQAMVTNGSSISDSWLNVLLPARQVSMLC